MEWGMTAKRRNRAEQKVVRLIQKRGQNFKYFT